MRTQLLLGKRSDSAWTPHRISSVSGNRLDGTKEDAMRERMARLREGSVTALAVLGIVLASMIGLNAWADEVATHVSPVSAPR